MSVKKSNIPKECEFVKTSKDIHEYRLKKNGLRILIKEDHAVPVATCMVTYHVGSRNEAIGHTGATHILEHLLFTRSKHFKRGYWFSFMDKGSRINATTWLDRTNYYQTLPTEHLEEAVFYEADRMRTAMFDKNDLEGEKPIVRSELEYRTENTPMELLDQNIWATAYQAHPYHHPTIGWRADIENVSVERLKEFYDTYYWPNNATLTLIGDVTVERALALAVKYFGKISHSPHAIPEVYTTEGKQEGPRHVVVSKPGETNIVAIAHKSPEGTHKDTYALQVLSRILGYSKGSRLYQLLVDKGLATEVMIIDFPFKDPGLFETFVTLAPGVAHEEIKDLVLKEYESIKSKGVTKKEVDAAVAGIETEASFSRDGSYAIAGAINEALAIGDWTFYTEFKDRVAHVTAADVQRVAQTYLVDDMVTTGFFIAKNATGAAKQKKDAGRKALRMCMFRDERIQKGAGMNRVSDRIKETEPAAGVNLLTISSSLKDAVTIKGSLPGGTHFAKNPVVPSLMARLLDQGTKKRSKKMIRETLEANGIGIDFGVDTYRLRFDIAALKEKLDVAITLWADMLKNPLFAPADFEAERKRYIAELKQAKDDAREQGQELFLATAFPKGHPNAGWATDELIEYAEKVSLDDIRAFHAEVAGAGTITMVAAGDVSHTALEELLKKHVGTRKESSLRIVPPERVASVPDHAIHKVAYLPEKTNVEFFAGGPLGISRAHPDFYPLSVAIAILGGSGSARLSLSIREKQSLTYSTQALIGGANNGSDGYWLVWAMFAPSLYIKGRDAVVKEVRDLVEKGVTAKEVAKVKTTVEGKFKVGIETTRGLTTAILANKEEGLPHAFLDEYVGIIQQITPKEVNRVIKEYIHPDKIIITPGGSLDDEGHPKL